MKDDRPTLDKIRERYRIKKIGRTAVVETKSKKECVFIDFVFISEKNEKNDDQNHIPGVKLIKKEDKKLIFLGFKKSTNKIMITVVDKNTLLSASKVITILVG